MRRYDYTLGCFFEDDSKEQFSGYSIVDGGMIQYAGEAESNIQDEDNHPLSHS